MTMRFAFSELIFPHYCCSCAEIGNILCESCYYDITQESEAADVCLVCQTLTNLDGVCADCQASFTRAWAVGKRTGALSKLISESKYHSRRAGCGRQAELLGNVVPQLPPGIIIAAVPTIRPHIRQRGYGHSELIARAFARRRRLPYRPLLRRVGKHVQQGASLRDRVAQAKVSYQAVAGVEDELVLLIDDVYTTGSSMRYAAQALLDGGAREVWVAVTARQTLDD